MQLRACQDVSSISFLQVFFAQSVPGWTEFNNVIFPLNGADGVLHPLPRALVAADARKKWLSRSSSSSFAKPQNQRRLGDQFQFQGCPVSQHLHVKDVKDTLHFDRTSAARAIAALATKSGTSGFRSRRKRTRRRRRIRA